MGCFSILVSIVLGAIALVSVVIPIYVLNVLTGNEKAVAFFGLAVYVLVLSVSQDLQRQRQQKRENNSAST